MKNRTLSLNHLRDKVYKIACEHGFHETPHSAEHCLMLVLSEISEAVEADRKGRYLDSKQYVDSFQHTDPIDVYNKYIKGTVGEELADAVIRLLDFAGLRGINVEIPIDVVETLKLQVQSGTSRTFTEIMFNICEAITAEYPDLEELIVTVISLIDVTCYAYDIDLYWYIDIKMEYNNSREYKHNKKY